MLSISRPKHNVHPATQIFTHTQIEGWVKGQGQMHHSTYHICPGTAKDKQVTFTDLISLCVSKMTVHTYCYTHILGLSHLDW